MLTPDEIIDAEISKIEQVSIVVGVPPYHSYHVSYSQVELHPSLLNKFPSSHSFFSKSLPSPHISMHVSFFVRLPPLQVKPVSILQVELQPSQSIRFPSSQPIAELRLPSPHVSVQTEGEVFVQEYPSSTIQSELHPSPFTVFPSSQLFELEDEEIPSPHTIIQISEEDEEPP